MPMTPATCPSSTIRSSTPSSIRVRFAYSREDRLDRFAIELAIRLGPGTANRRPLGPVEHPELDAAAIRRPAHDAIERIDFPDEMALAEAADGRVAGHLANGRKLVGDERGLGPEPRRRRGRLGPGVTAANDDDVERILDVWLMAGGCLWSEAVI